jgi:hypothetical protein
MRGLALAAVLASLCAAAPAAAPRANGTHWAAFLPRKMWVVEVEPGPCTPEFCRAGLNDLPFLIGVRYTKSQSGRQLYLDGRVRGCGRWFERSQALDDLDRANWQARYERMQSEMVSEMREACRVSMPAGFGPMNLRLLILSDER